MRHQDYMAEAVQNAADEAFRYAKGVPADKLEWVPVEGGRTVLDICRELTMTPVWTVETIQGGGPEYNEEYLAKIKEEQQQWKTVEDCHEECNRRLEKVKDLFRSISDERMSETKWLPYEGGRDFTVKEMMEYPRWNYTYHLGQIAYIQTLYGDKEMY